MRQHFFTSDRFFPRADAMRKVFDQRFANPRGTEGERFVWDYWHIPEQYTVVRTPAYHYFPKAMYESFHQHLVDWGRRNLGCHNISPPWLSYYVNGCRQELHADIPHGPWAFVFSLTPWKGRTFRGGETLILKPEVLDYWRGFQGGTGLEQHELVDQIPAEYNRLVVFDPRFPHGVSQVEGTFDPRESRLVVHGWFIEPRPFITGSLAGKATDSFLEEALADVGSKLEALGALHGTLSIRLTTGADGSVRGFKLLTETLVSLEGATEAPEAAVRLVRSRLGKFRFPRSRGASEITIPFLFR